MTPAGTEKTIGARLRRIAALPLLLPIELYRRVVSPFIAPRCRYYPTCSNYAVEALKTYGPIKGTILAAWRVVRCNPFSDGGFDAVEDQTLFKKHKHSSACADNHNHGVTA